MKFTLKDLEREYKVEFEKIISKIESSEAKSVLLQFPDGLKPWAVPVAEYIKEKTNANIRIWLGSCFGACDIPKSDCDLLIQFGHAEWKS
jgi:2-(3-amino-3-carboxypropyl)histidine synthase